MSWSTWAATLIGSKPVYLYRIEKDGEVAFYTSRGALYSAAPATMDINFFDATDFFDKVDFFAEDFDQAPIAHSVIRSTQKSKKKSVTITLPSSDTFAKKFIGPIGISANSISICQGFENDTVDREFVRIFLGEVQLVKPTWLTISLICEDAGAALRGRGISAVIQRPCRHALYHTGCGLSLSAYQDSGSASAFNSGVVTVAAAAGKPDGYYSGGIISYGGVLQLITEHTGSLLSVLGGVGSLKDDIATSGAQSVLIAAGCNRSISDCASKFSNNENFGGFKDLTSSPFDGRSMS